MSTNNTQARYRRYERALTGLCPSCRKPWRWSAEANAWQVEHTHACRYVPWFEAQQELRARAEAAQQQPTTEVAVAA